MKKHLKMRFYLLLILFCLKLEVYGNLLSVLKENIFIHTSADTLKKGETLWFKGYLNNSVSLENSDRVLYVDLVALKSNSIIKRKVLYMQNGTASGDFYFGEDLTAGNYLRAYTRWTANHDPDKNFEKVIFLSGGDDSLSQTKIKEDFTLTKNTSFKIDFFPEGGTWLNQQQTQFAVKIKSPLGKSNSQNIAVFNKEGNLICDFFTDSFGFGKFMLNNPDEGIYAVFKQDAQKKKYFLPNFSAQGVVMQMHFEQDSLEIRIVQAIKDTINNQSFLLLGKKSGEFFRRDPVPFGKELTVIKIPHKVLPDGLLTFELYQGSKLIAERLILVPSLMEDEISIEQENKSDSTFVKIKSSPNAQLSLMANLYTYQRFSNIEMYNISLELKNPVSFQSYLNQKKVDIDKLLLTLSSSDLKTKALNNNLSFDYSPEKGMSISGKVINRKKALAGINISLHLKSDRNALLLSSKTDSLGRFSFDNLVYYGKGQVKLVAMNAAAENVGTILLDTTFTTLELPVLPSDTLNKYNTQNLITRDSLKAETILRTEGHVLKEVVVKADRLNFLLNGSFKSLNKDQVFNLGKEDLEYQTLASWMLNHVKGASNPFGNETSGEENGIVFTGNVAVKVDDADNLYISKRKAIYPQFIVNGREYVYDYENEGLAEIYCHQFFDLPLNKVKSVRVQRVMGFHAGIGVLVDKYIIYLTIDDSYKEKGILNVKVNGFDESTPYVPDLKFGEHKSSSLLYWEPNITTNQNGEAMISFKRSLNNDNVTYEIVGKSTNKKKCCFSLNDK